jgi:2-oxo-4-hydroxy-4-carboxy--5-ureidoimidazoline (OHCU) decarboxylase
MLKGSESPLASFNAAPADEAIAAMLGCCASRRFAAAMAAGRPYPSTAAALVAGNAAYEDRFGHVFLICATGLTGDQMLAALQERLKNNEEMERTVATTELRKITLLRVAKVLDS